MQKQTASSLKRQPLIPKVIFFLISCSDHHLQEQNVVIRKFYLEKSTHKSPWTWVRASISCWGKVACPRWGQVLCIFFCISQNKRKCKVKSASLKPFDQMISRKIPVHSLSPRHSRVWLGPLVKVSTSQVVHGYWARQPQAYSKAGWDALSWSVKVVFESH